MERMYEVMQIGSGIRKWKKFIALWSLLLLFVLSGNSQQKALQELITLTMQDAGLDKIITAISKQSQLRFSYDPAVMKDKKISKVQWQTVALQKVLAELNALAGLEYALDNGTLALRIGERATTAFAESAGQTGSDGHR